MTEFVLLAALLAAVAVAVLTWPLWLKKNKPLPNPGGNAIGALREQLAQLTGLHTSGVLGDTQYAEARAALERRIVETVMSAPAAPPAKAPVGQKAFVLGLAAFVCVAAAGGYALLGTPTGLKPESVQASAAASSPDGGHAVTPAQIESMVNKLSARLKENPQDADGWAMMGRSYAVLGRHDQAVPAFKKAIELRPDDAVLLADYADAIAANNGRNLEGEPSRLIAQALKTDPENLKALSLAGTAAFDRKDYAGALLHWEKMSRIAPDSQFAQQIQSGIDEARKLMGGDAASPAVARSASQPATSAPTSAPTSAGATLSGTVTLSAALAARAGPDDTLFVFARPVEGSRMPLAILRKKVKDLPLTFTLDDSMAMSDAARLSSVKRVVVGARVSKSGDAMVKAGDLQGLSAPIDVGARGLKIEISELVGP